MRPLPIPSAAAVHRDDSVRTMDGAADKGRRRSTSSRREQEEGQQQQQYLVVCSTASAASQLTEALSAAAAAAATAAAGDGGDVATSSGGAGGAWEARSLLSLLADGWGGAIGFEAPKVRQQTLCATGVNRLVGRALR